MVYFNNPVTNLFLTYIIIKRYIFSIKAFIYVVSGKGKVTL
ncbi:hypothetical protein BH23BAC3_BH23BAC3_32160 [soil metagenome]